MVPASALANKASTSLPRIDGSCFACSITLSLLDRPRSLFTFATRWTADQRDSVTRRPRPTATRPAPTTTCSTSSAVLHRNHKTPRNDTVHVTPRRHRPLPAFIWLVRRCGTCGLLHARHLQDFFLSANGRFAPIVGYENKNETVAVMTVDAIRAGQSAGRARRMSGSPWLEAEESSR